MKLLRSVLYHFAGLPSMERCSLIEGATFYRLEGLVLTTFNNTPAEIRYGVNCNHDWTTRSGTVEVDTGGSVKSFRLEVTDDGVWYCNGNRLSGLDGLKDIDLGFSPCTNTLPIRRFQMEVGQSEPVPAVWLRFPEFEIVRLDQVYTRLGEDKYRYQSHDLAFTAELEVDELGLVKRYGDFWRRLV